MERYGKEVTVKEVVKKARCSNCGQKNNFEFRIIYIGGSYDAMLGGTTKQKNLTLFSSCLAHVSHCTLIG